MIKTLWTPNKLILFIFQPGRVATMVPTNNPNDQVWGLAYKIANHDIENVVNHLDFRERNGYIRKKVVFYPCNPPDYIDDEVLSSRDSPTLLLPNAPLPSEKSPFLLTIYIAEQNNPGFVDGEELNETARTICESAGLSGENREYLYKLAAAMRVLAPDVYDEHLFQLEKAVRKLDNEKFQAKNYQEMRASKCICDNENGY